MKKSVQTKQEREKEVVEKMIRIYCRHHHHQKELCPDCQELLDYAFQRVDHCPFMAQKTFCSRCKVHCYRSDRQEQIKKIMRYSGPRMLWVHPILAFSHWNEERKARKNGE